MLVCLTTGQWNSWDCSFGSDMSLFSACLGSALKQLHFSGTQWYCLFVLYWFLMAPNCRNYCKNQLFLPLWNVALSFSVGVWLGGNVYSPHQVNWKYFWKFTWLFLLCVNIILLWCVCCRIFIIKLSLSSITLFLSCFFMFSEKFRQSCHHVHNTFQSAVHFNTCLLNLPVAWFFGWSIKKNVFKPWKACLSRNFSLFSSAKKSVKVSLVPVGLPCSHTSSTLMPFSNDAIFLLIPYWLQLNVSNLAQLPISGQTIFRIME